MQLQDINSLFHQFSTMFMFMSIYFLLIIPNATSLSFNYTSLGPNDDEGIEYRGDATPSTSGILLTKNRIGKSQESSCGGAIYYQPLQLWNNTTGNLTDFTTKFSFVINSLGNDTYADGFAFFLGQYGGEISNDSEAGFAMCLTPKGQALNSTAYPFVAVEFDIFSNPEADININWPHVGVDINSVKSVATLLWEGAEALIMAGNRSEAKITYDSTSKNLSVVFTGYKGNAIIEQHLNYIVDLRDYLPERVTFGFSAATGKLYASYEIRSWNFTSPLEIQDKTQDPIAEEPVVGPPVPGSPTNANAGLKLGLGVGGGFALILVLVLIYFGLWKKWSRNNEEENQRSSEFMEEDFEGGTGPRKYSYVELASAANNFKDEQKLGQGGFGGVYKGFLKGLNSYVAIKRISKDSRQGINEFASEVRIISRLRHRNLVQLIGWCHERKQLLLVYEYMPNGSLDFHLFKDQSLLTWEVRYKIAQGLASALLYLHGECEQCVVHRDIKSSNIMLDLNFNAKLGDFGLARLVDHTKGSQTTNLAGTLGYMAPECTSIGKASKESDVYSFGIVTLEITCGRKPIKFNAPENEINIVEWVWELYGNERILEGADPRLSGNFEPHQMKCLMIVGLWCAHPDRYSRPSIRQAIQVLNFESPLPNLPSSLPVPTYIVRPVRSFASQHDTNSSVAGHDQNTSSSFTSNTNSSGITTASDNISPSVSLLHSR